MNENAKNPVLKLIQEEFARRQQKNPRYSIRSFGSFLNIESSTLSKILNEQRPLTFNMARTVLSCLKIPLHKRNALLLAFDDPKNFQQDACHRRELTEEELRSIVGWHFYAILSALELTNSKPTVEGISKAIGCEQKLVKNSISTLTNLGLVQETQGTLQVTGEQLTTTNEIPSRALREAHKEYIAKASEALMGRRPGCDFSGITMAISSNKLQEAKRLIRDFRRSLAEILRDGDKDSVYRINIQLFPLKP